MNATVVLLDLEPGVHTFLEQQQCLEKRQAQLLGQGKDKLWLMLFRFSFTLLISEV